MTLARSKLRRDVPFVEVTNAVENVVYLFSNLTTHVKLTRVFSVFAQALCGTIVSIPTLAGEKIQLNLLNEIVKPNTVKRIQGQGLPFPKEPNRKGDLLVSFDIKFPDSLTTAAKDILYDTLPSEY